ncbi:hypothetical protein ACFQY7_08635 [Actinomadura luteofluorescens]|uniref:hypothetical protein n=1 Tax=Actinomadura luteofluorescens TaxID=46163 RepID=UPI003630A28F
MTTQPTVPIPHSVRCRAISRSGPYSSRERSCRSGSSCRSTMRRTRRKNRSPRTRPTGTAAVT